MRYCPTKATLGLVVVMWLIGVGSVSALAAPPEFSSPSGFPAKFTAKSVASTVETIGGAKLKCKEGKGGGEVKAAKTMSQSIERPGVNLLHSANATARAPQKGRSSNPEKARLCT